MRVGDRDQRVDALGAGLADPDEDPGGERHPRAAGRLERGEPALRRLVGRAVVRAAGLAEAGRERLDHHPLRRAHRAQPRELGLRRARRRWRGGADRSRRARSSRDRDEVVDGRRVAVGARATRRPAGSAPRAPRRA